MRLRKGAVALALAPLLITGCGGGSGYDDDSDDDGGDTTVVHNYKQPKRPAYRAPKKSNQSRGRVTIRNRR